MKANCLKSPLSQNYCDHFLKALFLGLSFFEPNLGAISWAALGCQFPVAILCPDSGPGIATLSEMEGVDGEVAEPG